MALSTDIVNVIWDELETTVPANATGRLWDVVFPDNEGVWEHTDALNEFQDLGSRWEFRATVLMLILVMEGEVIE